MRFWDASALVPLCIEEPATDVARGLLEGRSPMVAWLLSATEIHSALCRKYREGEIAEGDLFAARTRRDRLLESLIIVRDITEAMRRADRLLLVHPLRAADALQLGAALLACDDDSSPHQLITFDHRLAAAARKEGFTTPINSGAGGAAAA